MSKTNADVPLTKDGHPDRRTVAGREAAAAEGEASPRKGKDGVPLNKDGTPDRRTVEGRDAADSKDGSSSDRDRRSSSSEHKSGDVPLTKDGHPDRRTVEGREAADREGSRGREQETKTRLDGEVDKRTVEGRQQVDSEQGRDGRSSSKDRSSGSSGSSDNKSSGEHQFEEGDSVVFNIGSNNLHGTISRVLTKDEIVDGRVAHGSKDEPRYAVKYEGTGVEQIRTEGALQKDEGQQTNDAGGKYSERTQGQSQSPRSTRSSDSDKSRSDSDKSRSDSGRRDDRYRKGHKFEEGETVVFHIGKQTLHGKIAKVSERSGDYKVTVGSDTITAKEKDLEKDKDGKSSSGSSSSSSSSGSSGSKQSGHGDHKFNEGDSVTFNIGLNNLHGTITRVITDEDVVDGRVAHGSKDEPRYAVQYEGTGVEQIRTEGALKKDDEKMDEDKSNKRKREDENKDNKDNKDNKSSTSKEPSPKKAKSSK